MLGLKVNFPQIQSAETSDNQFQKALSIFSKNPEPPSTLMNWVCRDNMDLTSNRLDLNSV